MKLSNAQKVWRIVLVGLLTVGSGLALLAAIVDIFAVGRNTEGVMFALAAICGTLYINRIAHVLQENDGSFKT